MTEFLINRAQSPRAALVLAHGAGAPMGSEFMQQMAEALSAGGISVYRFEFPYMQQRRFTGRKSPPNRQPVLIEAWAEALADVRVQENLPVFIGGKSMGGRMACILAQDTQVSGVVCYGYPFHPPGKPENTRLEPLQNSQAPVLIAQGTRDKLGNTDDVAGYTLPAGIQLHWLEDGDHDLKPRVKSGFTHEQHKQSAVTATLEFIDSLL